MAIKISNNTVINDSRKGEFKSLNPGQYTTAERDALSPTPGDIIFNTNEGKLEIWDGEEWGSTGSGSGGDNPNINHFPVTFTSLNGYSIPTVLTADGGNGLGPSGFLTPVYQWVKDGVDIPNENANTLNVDEEGTFWVKATVVDELLPVGENASTVTSDLKVTTISGVSMTPLTVTPSEPVIPSPVTFTITGGGVPSGTGRTFGPNEYRWVSGNVLLEDWGTTVTKTVTLPLDSGTSRVKIQARASVIGTDSYASTEYEVSVVSSSTRSRAMYSMVLSPGYLTYTPVNPDAIGTVSLWARSGVTGIQSITDNISFDFTLANTWYHIHLIGTACPTQLGPSPVMVSEFYFVEGKSLSQSVFSAPDGRPLNYQEITKSIGDFGASGFYLPFNTDDATLHTDDSDKGNDWTPVNVMVDVPAYLSQAGYDTPIETYPSVIPTAANSLPTQGIANDYEFSYAGVADKKYYWEFAGQGVIQDGPIPKNGIWIYSDEATKSKYFQASSEYVWIIEGQTFDLSTIIGDAQLEIWRGNGGAQGGGGVHYPGASRSGGGGSAGQVAYGEISKNALIAANGNNSVIGSNLSSTTFNGANIGNRGGGGGGGQCHANSQAYGGDQSSDFWQGYKDENPGITILPEPGGGSTAGNGGGGGGGYSLEADPTIYPDTAANNPPAVSAGNGTQGLSNGCPGGGGGQGYGAGGGGGGGCRTGSDGASCNSPGGAGAPSWTLLKINKKVYNSGILYTDMPADYNSTRIWSDTTYPIQGALIDKELIFDGIGGTYGTSDAADEGSGITIGFTPALDVIKTIEILSYEDHEVELNTDVGTLSQGTAGVWLKMSFSGPLELIQSRSGSGKTPKIGGVKIDGQLLVLPESEILETHRLGRTWDEWNAASMQLNESEVYNAKLQANKIAELEREVAKLITTQNELITTNNDQKAQIKALRDYTVNGVQGSINEILLESGLLEERFQILKPLNEDSSYTINPDN